MLQTFKAYFHRVSDRRKSYRSGRRGTVHKIEHDANEMKLSWLTMENDRGDLVVRWRDIVKLEAFKRDCFAVDLICLAICLADNTEVEINEEMNGWTPLMRKLPQYLSGCEEYNKWFDVVAYPPFKENLTVIYQRAA